MTLEEFITKWNGKGIDFDGAFGFQCMDLMHQYHVEVLGITDGRTLAAPGAKDVYLNFDNIFGKEHFNKIPNTPTGVPQKGDIVIWGTGIGPYGHIAVFIEGDTNNFVSFDQNFPTGSLCHKQAHTYNGVVGWLRAKKTSPSSSDALTECLRQHTELVTQANQKDVIIKGLNDTIKNLNDQLSQQKELIKQKELQLSTQETALLEKNKTIETLQQQADKVVTTMEERDQALNDRTNCLNAQESQNKIIAQLRSELAKGKPTTFLEKLKFLFL